MKRLLAIAAAASALVLAACGDDDSDTTAGPGGGAAPAQQGEKAQQPAGGEKRDGAAKKAPPAAAPGTEIKVADSEFGGILFDSEDQAIYLFDKETGPKSECFGACAEAWPPVLTEGDPAAGAGVEAAKLGTTKRDDGSLQVTYNGHPLYYYAHEPPGVVACHNVSEFGGLWLVVDAAGDAVS